MNEVRVEQGAVSDVRAAGKVLAESKIETIWDGTTTVTDVLIVDVGGSNIAAAMTTVVDRLQKSGWKVLNRGSSVQMASAKWTNTVLDIEGINTYVYDELEAPRTGKIADARARVGAHVPLILELHPVGDQG
ncbi:hypothetical protein [Nonomuraea dietziae]|uniref:hypothetical protein n=1 Tax=Nonomuraea dietziae TaxID=65515 RepID=UPI00342CE4CC